MDGLGVGGTFIQPTDCRIYRKQEYMIPRTCFVCVLSLKNYEIKESDSVLDGKVTQFETSTCIWIGLRPHDLKTIDTFSTSTFTDILDQDSTVYRCPVCKPRY